mmetsp:Transcript_20235/g.47234  ORF Transcript_20235/g.47234 Transcript_20235/m.47234 type:complete len:471 (+) Transcript_20235:122-1534(+)
MEKGQGQGSTEKTPLIGSRPPLYTYAVVACAALNSINLGYDIGVNSGVSVLVQKQWNLSSWQVGFYMGSLSFIAAAGALLTSGLADYLGRCRTFAASQLLFILGVGVSAAAPNYSWLMVGRCFLGIGIGVGLAIDPMYIAELAPADYRGSLTTWSEFSINVGILLGFVSNLVFVGLPANSNWRVMLGVGLVLPLVLLILSLFVMPESPRWLMLKCRRAEAEHVLQRTHATGTDVQPILDKLEKQTREERDEGSWRDLLSAMLTPGPARKQVLVGIGVALAQQASGTDSLIAFSPRVFETAGASTTQQQFFLTIIMGVVKTICIAIAACFLDDFGRRPLLILSNIGMSLCYFMLSAGLLFQTPLVAAAAVMLIVAAFSIGAGPVCWLLASELFPLKLRGRAMSAATFSNRIVCGVVTTTFLPLAASISFAGGFVLYGAIAAAIAITFAATVPETRMLTLEQISDFSNPDLS